MKKKLLNSLRVLLVAAGLCVGANASWGDTFTFNEKDFTIVYSDGFTDADNYSKYAQIGNSGRCTAVQYSRTDITGDDVKALVMYEYTNQNASSCYYNLFTSSESGISTYKKADDYAVTFDWSLAYGYNQASSFTIKSSTGATLIKFVAGKGKTDGAIYLNGSETADVTTFTPNPAYGYVNTVPVFSQFYAMTIWANETDGTKLTMVNQSDNTDTHTFTLSEDVIYLGQMEFGSGRYYAGVCIDNIKVGIHSDTEIVPNPSAEITAVNGTNRTVTMNLGTGSSEGTVIKYYTDTEAKSDLATYSTPFTVSETSTIYYYAESTSGAVSETQNIAVTCGAITLITPTINRTSITSVTITADQSLLTASPTATIYYSYGEETGSFTGSKTLTISADATITAYAEATGYTRSEAATREVALFPNNMINIGSYPENNTYSDGSFSGDEITGEKATYQALFLDEQQWGENIYFQTTNWGIRNGGTGKDWYVNSTDNTWLLVKNLKAGEILVINTSYVASSLVNATYSEKYSYGGMFAYVVETDGDIEIAFKKPDTKTMHYFYGINFYNSVNVSVPVANGWATYANHDYALDFSDVNGLTAYTATVSGNEVTFAKAGQVPAGTGVLLKKSTEDTSFDVPVIASAEEVSNVLFAPTTAVSGLIFETTEEGVTYNNYILTQPSGKAVGFYRANNSNVAVGKAYLRVNTSTLARQFSFIGLDGENETTGISSIDNGELTTFNVYNLNGQRVAQPQRGLYIVGSKKVIIK